MGVWSRLCPIDERVGFNGTYVHSVQSSQADPAKWGGGGWLLRRDLKARDGKEGQTQENLIQAGFWRKQCRRWSWRVLGEGNKQTVSP